tara:strand:- start:405 stop:653 length:249 start_codon:yes stop_codon:yes gene_type:complete
MKIFWPHRSEAKGFSIENLARKYREKISNSNFASNKNSNQFLEDKNLKSLDADDSKYVNLSMLSIKRGHWANRDFSEYKEAA